MAVTQKVFQTVCTVLEEVHGLPLIGPTILRPDAAAELAEMIGAMERLYIEHRILPQEQPCDQGDWVELLCDVPRRVK